MSEFDCPRCGNDPEDCDGDCAETGRFPVMDEGGAGRPSDPTCDECGLGPPPLHKSGCPNNVATRRHGRSSDPEPVVSHVRLMNAWNRHIVNSGHNYPGKVNCSPARCAEAIWNQYERNYASDQWDALTEADDAD